MGGNALKHLNPRRLTSNEVICLFQHISRNWMGYDDRPISLVPWIAEKETHGDIDIIAPAHSESLYKSGIEQMFGIPKESIVKNGDVLSVPFPLPWFPQIAGHDLHIAQVDFICVSGNSASSRFFYSGGDFGMMLGRVAAWHGLVFGMDGLRLRADKTKPWMKDVLLTNDPADILSLMGYKPARIPYLDTYQTMWKFIMSSPGARPWMFKPEATNAENRSRDAQRPKVVEFQEWLAREYPVNLADIPNDPFKNKKSFEEALAWVLPNFPDVRDDLQRQEQEWFRARKSVFDHGEGAVRKALLDQTTSMEIIGPIIREMQDFLPAKSKRPEVGIYGYEDSVLIAEKIAYLVAKNAGLPVRPQ